MDGRLFCTVARPIAERHRRALAVEPAPFAPNAHLRWHPLRGEWVAYATHRQDRTFLPPPEYNPLAPTRDPEHPTELPAGAWDVGGLREPVSALDAARARPAAAERADPRRARHLRGGGLYAGSDDVTRPAAAVAPRADHRRVGRPLRASLARAPTWHTSSVRKPRRGGRRHAASSARADLRVSVRAADSGARAGAAARISRRARHGAAGATWSRRTRPTARGWSTTGRAVAAFVPVCARYPYEVWVAPRRPVASIAALDEATCAISRAR